MHEPARAGPDRLGRGCEHGLLSLTGGSHSDGRLPLAGLPQLLGANTPGGPRLLSALERVGDDDPWTTPERMRERACGV